MTAQLRSSAAFQRLTVSDVKPTGRRLGAGAYGSVEEVDWMGTLCAAKTLHPIFFEVASPQEQDKLLKSFSEECLTWSSLRHPGVVQFLGVYSGVGSLLPVLVMEKMDTSLRSYFENHSKEDFPLDKKTFVLRQVSQALAYLHGQDPPLVHHDLSPNNVLLNEDSFVTKLTDFGMSRAIDPSSFTRKSSIKGTLAFMAPEALHDPPQYNEKLDVFSFGNIVLSTLTHEWPNPGPPNQYEGDVFVAITELQRRDQYVEMFTAQEKQLFLPTVCQCLENRPDKRPSSAVLVQKLRHVESSLPKGGHVAAPIKQLRQQLSAKEEECRQKDAALRKKDEALNEKDSDIAELRDALSKKDLLILTMTDEIITEMSGSFQSLSTETPFQTQGSQDAPDVGHLSTSQSGDLPRLEAVSLPTPEAVSASGSFKARGLCQQIIQHRRGGGKYKALAINRDGLLAVTDESSKHLHLIGRNGKLLKTFKKLQLSDELGGVAFDGEGNVWVADSRNDRVLKLSQDGRLLHAINHLSNEWDRLNHPTDIAISPKSRIYICNYGDHCVSVHDQSGRFLFVFGSKLEGDCPTGLTFALDGLLYVCDSYNSRIRAYQEQEAEKPKIVTEFATQAKPSRVASTNDDHLIVTSAKHKVMVYTTDGVWVHSFGERGTKPGQLDSPCGVAVDSAGNVLIAEGGNKRIQVFG